MSLFRCRTLWSVATATAEDDQCGAGCLLVTPSFTIDEQELIILGSYSGILRVFRPSANQSAQPSDLLLERQLSQPILQLEAGALVSGSSTHQLAILHPHSLSIYSLLIFLSDSELAHNCSLDPVFDRSIPESLGSSWQLLLGKFGGGDGSESRTQSVAVVTSCGSLAVYEREARQPLVLKLFNTDLPLPGPVTYCGQKDSFLIVNPAWELQAYKFNTLAKASREPSNTNMKPPDWSVSLGSAAIAIEMVLPSAVGGREPSLGGPELLVLGQRSLTCWQWSGTIKFARRLPATPFCMSHHLAEGCLMVLVASETLLLYRDGQLCWSSQPPFPPICMSTITICGTPGYLVMVSDELDLQVCYLGTQPALFCAPTPVQGSAAIASTESMTKELNSLNAKLKTLATDNPGSQGELTVSTVLARGGIGIRALVRLGVVAPLSLVNVTISTHKPIVATPATISISSLCNSIEIPVGFTFIPGLIPSSLDVHVAVSYAQADGTPKITQAEVIKLPLTLLTAQGPPMPQSTEGFRLSFVYQGDHIKALRSLLPGIKLEAGSIHLQGSTGQLVLNFTAGVCKLWSDSASLLSLSASSILCSPGLAPTVTSVSEPVKWMLAAVDTFYSTHKTLLNAKAELEEGSVWVRQVQLRLLTRYKDRSAKSLHGLDSLLFDSLRQVDLLANKVINAGKSLELNCGELSCLLRLCCQLLAVCSNPPSTEKLASIQAALSIDNVHKNWIEGTTANLDHISTCESGSNFKVQVSSFRDAQPAKLKSLLSRTFAALLVTV